MAEFIKEVIKENKISVKKCGSRNTRKTSLYQTRGHAGYDGRPIKINLPYEFHDYITEDKDKYFYDYAVINKTSDTDGNLTEMELMAVAAPKETINQYKTLFRRAGLRLTLIAPDYSAIRNIIKRL